MPIEHIYSKIEIKVFKVVGQSNFGRVFFINTLLFEPVSFKWDIKFPLNINN